MCGIAGFINYPEGDIKKAQKFLFHRGPDAQTSYSYKNVNLVHTRLSIQDIVCGAQPFIIENFIIIFNGEIYNHLDLRDKVASYTFQTQSDTETFLALYIEYGINAFSMCDGMFAFAILDTKSNKLILGRDRAGKKPLYYFKEADSMVFASELNTLSSCVNKLRVNEKEIYSYIRNGFFCNAKTPFKDVYEVSPGSILTVTLNDLKIQKNSFFDILDYYKKKKINEFESAFRLVDEGLHKSVKDRLLSSDLEVGAFLSGGIDSSLIVAIASNYVDKLKTFTVKFDGSFDESKLARLTAKKYNTDHTEIFIPMNLENDIEKILCNYGEPFMDSSAVPSYYVSQEAKKHVTVVLNGDGADELFGGYRRYVPIANNWVVLAKYLSQFANILPKPNNKQSNFNFIYRLLKLSSKTGLDFYNSATNDIFEDVYSFDSNDTFEQLENFILGLDSEDISALSKILIMDFNFILPSDLLKKMDIATMAHSLEGRSPFLSKYMLELAPTLNDKFKVKGLNTKVILRELGRKYLSEKLINQPKRGFEVPLKQWVNGELKSNILDSLSGDCYSKNFFQKGFVDQLIENKINTSDEKRAKMLWSLFCLESWKKNLI
jgi:asparagine synthase (glutamine-hydrolysing)